MFCGSCWRGSHSRSVSSRTRPEQQICHSDRSRSDSDGVAEEPAVCCLGNGVGRLDGVDTPRHFVTLWRSTRQEQHPYEQNT
jgi:hypothetical protein